jgi:DNA-directed RNA polymerase specialized sigma24 family protein
MNDDASFAALLRRACANDEQAATELYRCYEPELRRFIRFRLTDPGLRRFLDSLDICQSVLAAFFVHLQAGELEIASPRQLRRLLAVMAQNKLHDKLRRQHAGRRGGPSAPVPGALPELIADPRPLPDDAVASAELIGRVRERLPEAERQLLDRWLGGDEWPQMAADLHASPEALRKRLSRAIDRVAQELGLIEGPS